MASPSWTNSGVLTKRGTSLITICKGQFSLKFLFSALPVICFKSPAQISLHLWNTMKEGQKPCRTGQDSLALYLEALYHRVVLRYSGCSGLARTCLSLGEFHPLLESCVRSCLYEPKARLDDRWSALWDCAIHSISWQAV